MIVKKSPSFIRDCLQDKAEHDTFNRLRRTPIEELDPVYRGRMWEFYSNSKLFKEWLDKHGWDWHSFQAAGVAYEDRLLRAQKEIKC